MKSTEEQKIKHYTRKLKKNPQDPFTYYKRAKSWLELKQYKKASIDFNIAIKLDRKNPEFFYYRGLAHLGEKKYNKAIEDWTKAIDLDLHFLDIYIYRGQAYAKIQAYELAIKDFTESIERNPRSSISYCNRASVYFVRENYELALIDYERTLSLDPNNKLALFNRSILINILEKQGKKINSLFKVNRLKLNKKIEQNNWQVCNYLVKTVSVLAIGYIAIEVIPNSNYFSFTTSLETLNQKTNNDRDRKKLDIKQSNISSIIDNFKLKNKSIPKGIFSYGGSTVWKPIRNQIDSQITSANPDFKLRYLPHPFLNASSTVGIKMLINNQIYLAQSSRPLTVKEKQLARENGFELEEIPIAIDGIAIATHPDLNISGLSIVQLRDIYLGKITNWQEVGGPNLPIITYSKSPQTSGTADYFMTNVLDRKNKNISSKIKFVTSTEAALKIITSNKGAIFYESAANIIPQCSVKAISIGYNTQKLVSPYQENRIRSNQCST